jgi:pyrroline-5-carboxylate reductase
MKIAFIGGGVMAEAMIRGILDKGMVMAQDIVVSDISIERSSHLSKSYGVSIATENRSAAEKVEVIVLAVKPQSLAEVMEELKGHIQPQQLVLSIAAGATLAAIKQGLGHETIARAMPNMPSQIGEGVSVWTVTGETSEDHKEKARSILGALGKELFTPDEKYIDMATAVSGSGPAYILMIIESLIDAAVHIGLPHEMAEQLVLQTVLGAAKLVQETHKHPAELRNQVTSPGGTTAEGLLQLERGGLRALIGQAINASYEKAKALDKRG